MPPKVDSAATVARSESSDLALEFPQVIAMIAGLTETDVGGARLRALEPVGGERLETRRTRLAEVERLVDDGALVPALGEPVIALIAELGAPRPELDGASLLRFRGVLAAIRGAVERIAEADDLPGLTTLVRPLDDLGWLEERIASTLDERGRVRDDASPRLAKLRSRIGELRKKTYAVLEATLRERDELFSEDTVPLHEGRLVVMLKAGERGRVEGLVHGRSASGRSLYFEPLAAVESNNALKEAIAEEESERRRILRELADSVVAERTAIEAQVRVLAELDAWQAGARFATLVGGRLAELSEGDLVLRRARHPLLAPETRELRERVLGDPGHAGEVTPLDLELVGGERLLVVTGPNAGGKTVALKTVGLVVMLTLCGLPVPASAGTRVPVPSRLVAVVGDEQDLMRDRSTFSGRLLRLREAWEAAGGDGLVLIDELGSGTDPEEGSALAIALVEQLLGAGTMAIVTTHLMAVASTALDLDGASCAAMEFDHDSGRPTFRLVSGPPGGSEAIALGRQLGLPPEWLGRAEALLGEEHGRLQRLLAEVEAVRDELAAERGAVEGRRHELDEELERVEAERQALAQRRREIGAELERQLEEFRRRVRGEMGEEIERARQALAEGRRRGLEAEAVERLFAEAPDLGQAEKEAAPRSLTVGDTVRHARHGWEGVVERLADDEVEVSVRGKRVRCPRGDLRVRQPESQPPAGRRQRRGTIEVPEVAGEMPRELDLIGHRVEEAVDELDAFLDRALLAGIAEVRIVHGHGSGRLRRGVREFLDSHRAVASHRPGGENEGGDGATVVRLGA